jgi:maleamate amidohydrolase
MSGDFAAGFAGRLTPGRRPAVLAIDMMRAYFDQASPLCLHSSHVLQSANRVLSEARENNVPVIHTRVEYGPDGIDGGVFIRKVDALRQLVGGSKMGQLMPEVAPAHDELVIVKQYASAFFGTTLASTLQSHGVDTVLIVGVTTSGCVRATAVDALQHGFIPLVVRDAVDDRDNAPHDANLYDLQAKYAEVIDEKSALRYLREGR